jgi:DNA-binding transcriptional ArsR family regulator
MYWIHEVDRVNDKIGLDRTSLEEHLELLTDRGLVDSQNLGEDKTVYVETERGMKVLNVMGSISNEASRFHVLQF